MFYSVIATACANGLAPEVPHEDVHCISWNLDFPVVTPKHEYAPPIRFGSAGLLIIAIQKISTGSGSTELSLTVGRRNLLKRKGDCIRESFGCTDFEFAENGLDL